VKPHWPIVARDIGHQIGGSGASLRRQLHVSFDLADILYYLWVSDDVTGGLIIQQVPSDWDTSVRLRKYSALVHFGNRPILVVFGTLDWAITLEHSLSQECPVLSLVISCICCASQSTAWIS
jgi:hypothetical protein